MHDCLVVALLLPTSARAKPQGSSSATTRQSCMTQVAYCICGINMVQMDHPGALVAPGHAMTASLAMDSSPHESQNQQHSVPTDKHGFRAVISGRQAGTDTTSRYTTRYADSACTVLDTTRLHVPNTDSDPHICNTETRNSRAESEHAA